MQQQERYGMHTQPQITGTLSDLRKYSPVFVVLASIGGFIGDVLQPLGPILFYTTVLSAAAAILLTIFRKRMSSRTRLATGFLWVWFACSGVFIAGQWALGASSTGLAADVIPGIAQLQDRMGLVKQRLDEVHAQTTEINATTTRIESSVNELGEGIRELGQLGGIVPDPQTPEQWYSNAKLYELKGDFGNARRAYLQCLTHMPDKIDAHLAFVQFLKAQEGRVGAREVYLPIARRSPGVGTAVALASLLPSGKQAEALELVKIDDQIPAPVLYLLSDRYSESRLGVQSLSDKRSELKWLELFVQSNEQQPYLRYFADQSMAVEWSDAAASRLAALEATTSTETLRDPVLVSINVSNSSIMVGLSLAEVAVDIAWRGTEDGEFVSTGLMDYIHPDTGRRMPNSSVQIPLQDGDVHLEVQYTTPGGQVMGPYDVSFNALDAARARTKELLDGMWTSWVSFRADGYDLIYFSHIVSSRLAVKSVRYKLDDDERWTDFPVVMGDSLHGAYAISGDTPTYIRYPVDTQRVRVQLEYYDGTWSEVREFQSSINLGNQGH
jgi:hypothetical protein